MRKFRLVLPAVLAAGLLFLGSEQFASSAPHQAAAVHQSKQVGTDAVGHGAPVKTYFTNGDLGLTLTAGVPTAVGAPVVINCPGSTGTCKIEMDNMAQFNGGSTADNLVAIWEQRGGTVSTPGGPFLGDLPTDGSFLTGSDIEQFNRVNHGNHPIQPMVYSSGGGSLDNYVVVIRVYKP